MQCEAVVVEGIQEHPQKKAEVPAADSDFDAPYCDARRGRCFFGGMMNESFLLNDGYDDCYIKS